MAASARAGQLGNASKGPGLKSGYAPLDGLKLYYEIHGVGAPLIVMHGGLGSIEMFGATLPALASGRQVIAVDLQAHGRTADIERPLSLDAMAEDIAALLKYLQIEKPEVMGYSLGAGVALRLTVNHPGVVRKLVVVSTPYKRDGWYPEVRAAMAQIGPELADQMRLSPLYQQYAKVAPRPGDWPVLVTKVGKLVNTEYDWTPDVAAIKVPTMIVFGDADAVQPQHIVEFFQLLGGGKRDGGWDGSGISNARLAILPGVTHYNIAESAPLVPTVAPFLDAAMAEGGGARSSC